MAGVTCKPTCVTKTAFVAHEHEDVVVVRTEISPQPTAHNHKPHASDTVVCFHYLRAVALDNVVAVNWQPLERVHGYQNGPHAAFVDRTKAMAWVGHVCV